MQNEPKTVVIEGSQHELELIGDVVMERWADNRPRLIRRIYKCSACSCLREDTIAVNTWEMVGRVYKPVEGVEVQRRTPPERIKASFKTNKLSSEDVKLLGLEG